MQKDERHPLSDAMRARVLQELDRIERERNAGEAAYGPRRPALHAYIQAELERSVPGLPRTHGDSQQLDQYLRDTVKRFA
ncbi:hypothetical protein BLL37_08015 [Pseudomonas azotoformans]|uniref:Uncharacterized protein n=1 Tax=Pseudomonas azotoformans TaxID=47878 RepID=A0A1V2JNU7_PSEAZ|nr:hypothetical protein BFL39_17350 [Pseudomonas azotoformans]ONH46805.1 hypothetical protein BLL37_08015 [Pseudomonas azotoformans]SDM90020.1 hypothetical protein SAMN04489799_0527 [Pseudomonas azotoformans]